MKTGFFSKIAWTNIKNNYRFFIPRILSEAGLLGVFYIIFTLKADERLLKLRGGEYLGMSMSIGTAVMTLLSAILMFYINSFLMKQRKREFGVYNILGMEKRHVGRVLFCETLISSTISVVLGLCLGMLFYKICSLLICKLLGTEVVFGFYFIKVINLVVSALLFVALDVLTYLFNRISIAKMKPVELLASSATGEKEPKVKWLMLVLGLAALGGGYYISLTTQSPLKAMALFFLAVILVIIGTYFLFVTGSIFVLKLLKKNTRYYYSKKHMPAVSGLLYRMKQNAVGLASICILATGVLVMISTTVSLYSGMQDTLDRNYPQHYYVSAIWHEDNGNRHVIPSDRLRSIVEDAAAECGAELSWVEQQKYLKVAYIFHDGMLETDRTEVDMNTNLDGLCEVTFLTEDVYRQLGGSALNLSDDEVAFCAFSATNAYEGSTLELQGTTYRITEKPSFFPIQANMVSSIDRYGMVVANDAVLNTIYQRQKDAYGDHASDYIDRLAVTFADKQRLYNVGRDIDAAVRKEIRQYITDLGYESFSYGGTDSVWAARESTLGMYSSLLFLGILLGAVCLFATTLIIYYKQISEGYEDRNRFQIMQKIGMSASEVRKTINSQVLLVFFLPLVTAGVHLTFAFPILDKLLHILLLSSTRLFVICSIITYGAFILVYVLIYNATARIYYKIVR